MYLQSITILKNQQMDKNLLTTGFNTLGVILSHNWGWRQMCLKFDV